MGKREDIIQEGNKNAGVVLLDYPALQSTCLNKDVLIDKLLGLYVQQAPGWIDEIEQSVLSADPERVRIICHTVKGATAAIQATACVQVLEELHRSAREDNLDNGQQIMNKAVLLITQTGDVIKRFLEASNE